jgi:hypothetical protein
MAFVPDDNPDASSNRCTGTYPASISADGREHRCGCNGYVGQQDSQTGRWPPCERVWTNEYGGSITCGHSRGIHIMGV